MLVLGNVLGVDFVVVVGFVVDACIGILLYEFSLLARPQQLVGVGVITTKLLKQILGILVGKRVRQILQSIAWAAMRGNLLARQIIAESVAKECHLHPTCRI